MFSPSLAVRLRLRNMRLFQTVLIVSTLAFSWLAMMVVHEFGHVLHLWLSGGTVERVVLHPLVISRTDPGLNPRPLFVAWGGPVWGCIIPLILLGIVLLCRWSWWYLVRFFAGFCLIANGAYLAGGSFDEVGDAGDILRHGSPRWTLFLFGIPTVALGLWFWHRLGPHFGLGPSSGKVDRRAALVMLVALILLVAVELCFGSVDPW
jgi:hypothetical protein